MSQLTETVPARAAARRESSLLARVSVVGGIGGLVFVVGAVIQNILRAKDFPADDASATKIIAYYSDHLGTSELLAAMYVVGAIGVMLFVGTLLSRLLDSEVRGPALIGALGFAGVLAMFTMTVAVDVALAEYVHRGAPDPSAVATLWVLHNAVFGLLLVSIGVTLGGLCVAAAGAGVVHTAWRIVGPVGGVLLAVAAACTPAIVDGSNVLALGLVGFITWLLFVATGSVSLLRRARAA